MFASAWGSRECKLQQEAERRGAAEVAASTAVSWAASLVAGIRASQSALKVCRYLSSPHAEKARVPSKREAVRIEVLRLASTEHRRPRSTLRCAPDQSPHNRVRA
jgi:hypothetical protein